MHPLPFDRPGRFWRGNLHTHSTHRDGALPPDQISDHYQEAGYDFVAMFVNVWYLHDVDRAILVR